MKMKKQLLALLLAAVMVLSLTGCKETLKKVAQKVTGHSEEVQEEDTTRWAEATTDPLIIQGIADASAKYATATADGCLYAETEVSTEIEVAVLLAVGLTGCKDVLKGIVHKATGTSDEVQEEDTTRWADATADPLIIQGIADPSAKFAAATADGCLYAVFNGIWSRNTGYFTVPGGSLNIMACGTAEGTQKFKVALWKKVDGGAEYVPDSTYYVKTDGTDYRCTISGLDPAAQYRVTISYDSSRYYLYGLLKVEGIAG